MTSTTEKPNGSDPAVPTGKKRVSSDFPKRKLQDALRVANALDKNGGQPMPPFDTAMGMELSPGSFLFRDLLSASFKYGLTKGTQKAATIQLQGLGESVISPKAPDEKAKAMLTAALTPPTFEKIYNYYKGKKFPESEFFVNTVVRQFDVPNEHAQVCEQIFRANMEFVGLLKETNGGVWLSADPDRAQAASAPEVLEGPSDYLDASHSPEMPASFDSQEPTAPSTPDLAVNNRVFITHGKNAKIVDQVKELLIYGKFDPVVSVEKHTVSKPVPEKVLDDMRLCGAAVIHVGTDQKLIDEKGESHTVINPNVLIEIGAAMALYGRNFILLVERGTDLPSNLQGLYEVRYEGDGLDHEATMRLLKSFNDFQK